MLYGFLLAHELEMIIVIIKKIKNCLIYNLSTIYLFCFRPVIPVDSIPPVISGCPQPITTTVPFGSRSRVVTWTEPFCVDNTGVPPEVIQSHQSGDDFVVGTTQVSYICSDQAGNQATCSFQITGNFRILLLLLWLSDV